MKPCRPPRSSQVVNDRTKAGLLTRFGPNAFPANASGMKCPKPWLPFGKKHTAAGTVAASHGIPF